MSSTALDRDPIFLLLALTEGQRAVRAIEEVQRLALARKVVQPGLERRELQSVFDHIRLALQFSSNLSKIFWPQKNCPKAVARGERLREIVGLPETHPLSDRRLRNHIEHIDERLDEWTDESPRPFLSIEMVLYEDLPESVRDNVVGATAICYDATTSLVILFGHEFSLLDLRNSVAEVVRLSSAAFSKIA